MTRALLVDDDRDLARLLTEYLTAHEVTITHVEDGRTFRYSAAQPRSESIGHKVREVIDTICGGSPEATS